MINLRIVARILGSLALLEALLLLGTLAVGIVYAEARIYPFIVAAAVALATGMALLYYAKGAPRRLTRRDGYLSVALAWVMFSLIGAIPFLLCCAHPRVAVAVFEATSGFTTTGATALTDLDTMPRSLLFWRSLMHWMGGLGIIFFTVALLPSISGGSVKLFAAETTGLKIGKLHPRVSTTARWIWGIYLTLTLMCFGGYALAGMPLFDAANHAMSTIASGGFSTHQESLGFYHSAAIELTACVFMFLAGVNFTLIYTTLLKRRLREFGRSGELRFMVMALFVAVMVMWGTDIVHGNNVFESLRTALFTGISIQSTTGFITADYMARYTPFVWVFIFLIGVIGPMAGSTGGGIKTVRVMTAMKVMLGEFRHILHPRAVLPVRIAGTAAGTDVLRTMFAFFVAYIVLLVMATLCYLTMGLTPLDAFGVAASMLSNVGPAVGYQIGATGSLDVLPDAGLWLSSLLMLIGRLEIFAILLPFVPEFWKDN
ncbi:MAG: TrkH family potassium uptake protein [Bacteroidaceae bacterium]|nr:TrkH family potassium uptake protein [Bacteroidaceae bacterium]